MPTRSRRAGKFIPCHIMELPARKREQARAYAVAENPANAPRLDALAATLFALTGAPEQAEAISDPQFLAAITTKYWGPGGVNLSVSFLDNPSASLRNRILANFNAWGEFCNAKFSWVQSGGDVRVARNEAAYYSYLGTDIRMVPRGQHTMMLGGFSDRTTDAEMRRVAAHECGHTMGFPHEHLRRQIIARISEAKALAYFRRTQGWSDATTRSNVLTPLEERSIMGSDITDEVSLMCYGLPGEITTDGRPIPGGSDFSAVDRRFAATLYPLAATPTPPTGAVEINIPRGGTYVLKQ